VAVVTRAEEIAHAREVDTEVARLYALVYAAERKLQNVEKSKEHYQDYIASGYDYRGVYARKIVSLDYDLPVLRQALREARTAAEAYNKEHYKGWSRFFLVKHIHNSMYCPSFRPTTKIGWLPDVSGLTEAEAVKEHGTTLCTKCFPTAPVELTTPQADPTVCPGSGGPYDHEKLTGRERAHYYPAGTCPVCGAYTALTARFSGKLRKHKIKEGA
jgi:hypothetical protein